MSDDTAYLATVQLSWGGLLRPADGLIHLVRGTGRGTPGPLLCGFDRFAEDAPGFSVGGGINGPGMTHIPCDGCVAAARKDFAGLPVAGMPALSRPIAEAIPTDAFSHSMDVPGAQGSASGSPIPSEPVMTTPREQLIEAIASRFCAIERNHGVCKEMAEAALRAIEDQDYVLIKSKDENGNPLIVASAEAVKQISEMAIEEFREVGRQREMRAQS